MIRILFISAILLPLLSHCSSEISVPVISGRSYTLQLEYQNADGTNSKKAEGIKRQLFDETGGKWQYFWFCGGNKKTCGKWVDEKNQIVPSGPKVTKTSEGAVISNMQIRDSGKYARLPEDPNALTAELQQVKLFVQDGPKPPGKVSKY
ncbi:hypothetical protein CRE_30226 [Caenorhabditis remanei]|uniref:Uncharacterized protein n=1 Tax=Caenorhabditis remanei TaxID=31234 RepID=E3NI86_CAERE|nr:hypothetical protein CRE_30226 [Caenorhabditis remanei]